ncbi:MAG: hypothetical protein LBJ67_01575, partial [Planctomycetaceae bacterium]|jgi:hypothetical protein|nr:hypothetical protein [Planctomycetaceae bacterium]
LPVAQGYFTGNVTLQVSLGNSSENDYIVGQKNSADAKLQTSLISEEQDFIPKSTISRDFPEISETYPQAVNRASSVLNNIEIATAANARIVEIDTYFSQPKRVIYGNNIEYTVSDKRLSEIDWKKSSSLSAFDSVFSSWDHFISILESEQLQKEFF